MSRTPQWLMRELTGTYGYPESMLVRWDPPEVGAGEAGVAATLPDGTPFLLGLVGEGKVAPVASLRAALLSSDTAGLGVAVGDGEVVFLRRRFDASTCELLSELEQYDAAVVGEETPQSPLPDRNESLLHRVHDSLRDVDGLHADEALDELCKLLAAKAEDERLTGPSEAWLQAGRWGCAEQLAAATRLRYAQLGRCAVEAPLRLSSPAAARAMTLLARYRLDHSDTDVKGRAFQQVIAPVVRAGMGQYFTPEPVVRFMVEVARPRPGERIGDPFCGSARFLAWCARSLAEAGSPAAAGDLHGIEKSERMVRVARTALQLGDDVVATLRCADALVDLANFPDLEPASFDLVLTNPPFGALLGPESLGQLGHFELARGRTRVGLEVLGLERCLELLRPGGRLGIVVPDGLLGNDTTGYLRQWLADRARLRAVVSLPVEAFTPFGANIKTSVIFGRRWLEGEPRTPHAVQLVRVDDVGYDTAGRERGTDELPACAASLRAFLDREGW